MGRGPSQGYVEAMCVCTLGAIKGSLLLLVLYRGVGDPLVHMCQLLLTVVEDGWGFLGKVESWLIGMLKIEGVEGYRLRAVKSLNPMTFFSCTGSGVVWVETGTWATESGLCRRGFC